MRRFFALMAITIVAGFAATAAAQDAPVPPSNLKLVHGHWTAWDSPEPGEGDYIIVKGDTLWDLAEKWLGDPYLWPRIHEENSYILDSHWIYPGDPLVIPGEQQVVPEDPSEMAEDTEPTIDVPYNQDDSADTAETAEPVPAPLVPVADARDVYCSGYIDPEHLTADLNVAGYEDMGRQILGEGDVVYLNAGRNQGVQPGDEFMIVREVESVEHPINGQMLGNLVTRLGRVRVMISHDNASTALIEMSCEDVHLNDALVPWEDIPVPMRRAAMEFDRYDVMESGGPAGHVVHLNDDITTSAAGHVIHTDLGVASGVRPGDVLTVYRDGGELPRIKLAQAIVLTVEPMTSTAKLTYSVMETEVGNSVEVTR